MKKWLISFLIVCFGIVIITGIQLIRLQATYSVVPDVFLTIDEGEIYHVGDEITFTLADTYAEDEKIHIPLMEHVTYVSSGNEFGTVIFDEEEESLIVDWTELSEIIDSDEPTRFVTIKLMISEPGDYLFHSETIRDENLVYSEELTVSVVERENEALESDETDSLENELPLPEEELVEEETVETDNVTVMVPRDSKEDSEPIDEQVPTEQQVLLVEQDQLDIVGQSIAQSFPDKVLASEVARVLKTNTGHILTQKNITQITSLNLANLQPGVQDLSGIGILTELKELNLKNNQLSHLSAEIGQLGKLKNLDISGNNITVLPENIGNLGQLELLDATNNPIKEVPTSIGQLTRLVELRFSHGDFDYLPDEIMNLSALQVLHVTFCQNIEFLPNITEGIFPHLRVLQLQGSNFTTLEGFLEYLPNLRELNVNSCQLINLPYKMIHLRDLREVDIGGNMMTENAFDELKGHMPQIITKENNPQHKINLVEDVSFRIRDEDEMWGIDFSKIANRLYIGDTGKLIAKSYERKFVFIGMFDQPEGGIQLPALSSFFTDFNANTTIDLYARFRIGGTGQYLLSVSENIESERRVILALEIPVLSFQSAPTSLSFGTEFEVSSKHQSFPLASMDQSLVVTDTRVNKSSWEVRAKMTEIFTSEDGLHTLPRALQYKFSGKNGLESTIISDKESVPIYSYRADGEEEVDVSELWLNQEDGLFLEIMPYEARAKSYTGTLQWTLADVPGNR